MFSTTITSLEANLQGLRDFVTFVEPAISAHTKSVLKKHRDEVRPILDAIIQHADAETKKSSVSYAEGNSANTPSRIVTVEEVDGEWRLKLNAQQNKAFGEFIEGYSKSERRFRHLYEGSLMTLTSNVEWFFSRLLHICYTANPGSIIPKEKVFSFEDLKRLSNFEDATISYIERRIEDVLRSGFKDWIEHLKSHMKLSMSYIDSSLPKLTETFERRNLIIHNQGMVNNIYLANTVHPVNSAPKIGDKVQVTKEYLEERITLYEINCILIGAEIWKKLEPNSNDRGHTLIESSYEAMKQNRWEVSKAVSFFVMNDKALEERAQLVGKMNYWLSKKRLNEWKDIEEDSRKEDMSARDRLFQLAWFALHDNLEDFFALLPAAMKGGQVDYEMLTEYPIFSEVRKDDRFKNAVTKLKPRPKRSKVKV